MKKTIIVRSVECVLCLFFAMAIGFVCGERNVEPIIQEKEVIKYVEVIKEELFDTSILETMWCGSGFEEGTIRMVGAWHYADGVVEDEQGQLWGIDQQVDEQDFLLLWIADNNTPNKTTDDIIIKVWREAY